MNRFFIPNLFTSLTKLEIPMALPVNLSPVV